MGRLLHLTCQRRRPRQHLSGRSLVLLVVFVFESALHVALCQSEPISLTDKTFDSVREAFNYPSMLILAYSSKVTTNSHKKILQEFGKLPNDSLLREKDIMLITVDVAKNRMLGARMGIDTSCELPALTFLYGDRMHFYRGEPPSAELMRSYALQGYLNQGAGEPMLQSSFWLLLKTKYYHWVWSNHNQHHASVGTNNDTINITAVVISGFTVGVILCIVASLIFIKLSEESTAKADKQKKR